MFVSEIVVTGITKTILGPQGEVGFKLKGRKNPVH